jgi:hypothetical protein
VPAPEEFTREERRIRLVRHASLVLIPPILALVLLLRFRPDVLVPAGSEPEESGAIATVKSPPLRTVSIPGRAPHITRDEPQDTSPRTNPPARRRRPPVATDVLLLPCSMPNPRPDGAFIIPPHDPKHRTIVGLPSGPGEPKRGFVVPPHDPSEENRVPIEVISLDTLLERSLRVPPHNPDSFNYVRRDTLPCRADSPPT